MTTFQPEVERLRRLLDVPDLERALASLPVYRTYVEPWSGRVEDADREAVAGAAGRTCAACCCWRSAATTSSSRASSRRPAR